MKIDKRLPAFNLQELLVVLVIIGILILLALPSLMPLITKAKSIEAQTQLKHIAVLEQQYFYMYSKYNNELTSIDFEAPKTVTQGGTANYIYELVEVTNTTFKAKATAITDFDGDGIFNVWEIDKNQVPREVIKD